MTQEYVGTKIVTAWKQEGGPKVQVCGRDCTEGAPNCNGYCTGKSPHPQLIAPVAGYAVKTSEGNIGWMPEAEFEKAFVAIGHVSHLPDFQQRLAAEAAQLGERVKKLTAFTTTEAFNALDAVERQLLLNQQSAMIDYLEILAARIERLAPSNSAQPTA